MFSSYCACISIIASTSIALLIYSKNRRYDQAKETLKNLYNPLNSLIEKREKYLSFLKMRDRSRYEIEYYTFFLELRDIYLPNASYGTPKLRMAFHHLIHDHEVNRHIADINNSVENTSEEFIRQIAKFELQHQIDNQDQSEFERKMEELIRIISIEQHELYKEIEFKFKDETYV